VLRITDENHEQCERLANFMFEFPCIISLYYIKNQQDATLGVLFISNCKITLHVSDASRVHHQECLLHYVITNLGYDIVQ